MEPEPQVTSALSPESDGAFRTQASLPASEESGATFERLEYGKLCTSPDGPIEPGVESYPLAVSAGFPKAVETFCRPWSLGVGPELAPGAPHGTVLRCLRVDGIPIPVFCRLRQRPEDGEGRPGRRFWRGRYLWCHGDAPDPFTGLRALESRPLRGITIQESKQSTKPIEVSRQLRPKWDDLLGAFLPQALELVLSGIPVGVAGGVDEPTFFRQAAALWFLLPPPLRPLFSAGWSVPSSEAASLSFSATVQFPSSVAVFEAPGRWRIPAGADLIPGQMFMREAFEWKNGRPRLEGLEPRLGYLGKLEYGIGDPKSEPKGLLDVRTDWVRERFCRPGLRSLDHARFQELERWLEGIWEGDPVTLCPSTSQYFFSDARFKVFKRGLEAMERPEQRPRGDQVIWHSLLEDRSCHALLDSEQIAVSNFVLARARLMRALALGGWPAVLDSVEEAVEHGAALNLLGEVAQRLDAELTASLDEAGALENHRRLLTRIEIPEPYHAWAVRCAARLAVALGTAEDSGLEQPLRCLNRISKDQAIVAMLHFQQGREPLEGDIVNLRSLTQPDAELLGRNLLELWGRRTETTRQRRERIFPWIEPLLPFLGPAGQADPLLSTLFLPAESREVKGKLLLGLVEEIQGEHVPDLLEMRVAAVVLRDWGILQPRYAEAAHQKPWRKLISYWPPEAALALAGMGVQGNGKAVDPTIESVLQGLRLPARLLDGMIESNVARGKKHIDGRASRLLWNLCSRCIPEGGPITAAEICQSLSEGILPEGSPTQPAESKKELVIHLAHTIRNLELPDPLWSQAIQPWQIRFFLELAPTADLKPIPQQLSALIPDRKWLRGHLESGGLHAHRESHFKIASEEFHRVSYSRKGWKHIYEETPLWAAFKGVPLKLQGDLREALVAYSDNSQDQMIENAIIYLDGQFDRRSLSSDEAPELFKRVARAVFAPLLHEAYLDASDLEEIFRQLQKKSVGLFGPVVDFRDSKRAFHASSRGDEIVVAEWMKPLLEKVWVYEAQRAVVAEVRRVLEARR